MWIETVALKMPSRDPKASINVIGSLLDLDLFPCNDYNSHMVRFHCHLA